MAKLLLVIFSVILFSQLQATRYYVKIGGSDAGAGTSWAAAFATVQKAMDGAVNGDTVWIARGRFTPTGNGTGTGVSFKLKNGVALYGGFAGTEAQLTNRDITLIHTTNETILSGDIVGNDDPNDATLTINKTDNAVRVFNHVTADALNNTAVLNGATISGGSSTSTGAGMYNQNCSPTLVEVYIKNNIATTGAGFYVIGSSSAAAIPVLTNIVISGNIANTTGGGLYCITNGSPQLTNVIITNNKALGTATANGGGGIYIINTTLSIQPAFTNLTVSNNSSTNKGGGIFIWGSSPVIKNAVFNGNTARNGAGIFITPNGLNTPYSYPTFTNVLLNGNTASEKGGAVSTQTNGFATFINATISNNTAPAGAAFYDSLNGPRINNSIIWGNSGPAITNFTPTTAVPVFSHSLVQGSGGSGTGWQTTYGTDSINNKDADPQFVNGYSLAATSPALNAGNNSLYTALATNAATDTTLAGTARISNTTIDMGAYEYLNVVTPVHLLSFTAQQVGNRLARVQWQVTSENLHHYVLERSADGSTFATFAILPASGKSTYSVTDASGLQKGKNYYRLKMVDADGSFTYSGIVAIAFGNGAISIAVWPNPVTDFLRIRNTDASLNGTAATVTDVSGRTMLAFSLQAQNSIALSGWAKGIYFLKAADGTNVKVMKE